MGFGTTTTRDDRVEWEFGKYTYSLRHFNVLHHPLSLIRRIPSRLRVVTCLLHSSRSHFSWSIIRGVEW
jgi:hypothetical protein